MKKSRSLPRANGGAAEPCGLQPHGHFGLHMKAGNDHLVFSKTNSISGGFFKMWMFESYSRRDFVEVCLLARGQAPSAKSKRVSSLLYSNHLSETSVDFHLIYKLDY